ncbi:MAG: N-acyl-D-amino acid deacylase [Planctomycetaceae bacterium]|nr:N-acyl-D-amino acid deacylase [Planctomycetaceae bacterium]
MRQNVTVLVALFALSVALISSVNAQQTDVLLKGATVYDGTAADGRKASVAIADGKILAIGQFNEANAVLEIDCQGLVIAPGFIDLHNHSDRQIVDRRTRANINYVLQGCTTIVTGNCGSGPVDVGAYLAKIDEGGAGTNVVHLLPQGSLRQRVIGTVQRDATAGEISKMKQLTDKAMSDGAWGMSTGLIYVPSSYASTDELVSLAEVVSKHGGIYASHIRNENVRLLAAVGEAMSIGQRAGLPVHISHFKSSGRESWGLVRRAADMIQTARDKGHKVTADQYPYVASSTSLGATLIPTWARAGGSRKLLERLADSEQGPRIRKAMAASLENKNDGATIRIARYSPRKDWVGKSVAQIADSEKKTSLEIALEITKNGGAAIVNFSMSEDDVRHIMQVPWVATASDGRAYLPGADKPHPRSYGTFPRKLGHYSIRESVLSLSQAVRSASGLPADILGIKDRGYLKKGLVADIVVFDPAKLKDAATFEDPHQLSQGIQYVLVNGEFAVYRGRPTGNLAGKALRHSSTK